MKGSLSKRKRFSVFQRDGFTCQYCGRRPPDVMLQVDHIVPSSKGGSDDTTNLITSCFDCNSGKSDTSLDAVPDSLVDIQSRRIEALQQAAAVQKLERKQERAIQKQIEDLEAEFVTKGRIFNSETRRSIRLFLTKLGYEEVFQAMHTADARGYIANEKEWRYFCGICWNRIREREGSHDAD